MNERAHIVRGRRGALALLITLILATVAGCAARGGASCEEACDAKARACGDDASACMRTCVRGHAVAEEVGCGDAYAAMMGCAVEHANVCDPHALCEAEAEGYFDCHADACAANPASSLCTAICYPLCDVLQRDCSSLDRRFDCDQRCSSGLRIAAARGCGTELWRVLQCDARQAEAGYCGTGCEADEAAFSSCMEPSTAGAGG